MLLAVPVFLAAAASILVVGPRMARVADRLSKVTGLGGALFGLVFLALATDLPEVALTPTAVLTGTPRIATGSLLGSAAAQLALVAVIDIAVRRRTVYQQAPVLTTVGQSGLMIAVLAVPVIAVGGVPRLGWVGLDTLALALAYVGGLAAIRQVGRSLPAEHGAPVSASSEREAIELDDHDAAAGADAGALWRRFAGFAVALAAAGVALELTSEEIGSAIGLGETGSGALLAGFATSLPELVTAWSAAKVGALDLAIGDVVGSSALDVALLVLADVLYTDGSIFELIADPELALIGVSMGITALLVLGVSRREHSRPTRVGAESVVILALYASAVGVLVTSGA